MKTLTSGTAADSRGAARASLSLSRIQASMAQRPGGCSASSGVTPSLRLSSIVEPSLPSRDGVPSVLVSWLLVRTPVILEEWPILSSGTSWDRIFYFFNFLFYVGFVVAVVGFL